MRLDARLRLVLLGSALGWGAGGPGCGPTAHQEDSALGEVRSAVVLPEPTWGSSCPYPSDPVFTTPEGGQYVYLDCATAPGGVTSLNSGLTAGTGLRPLAATSGNYTFRGDAELRLKYLDINHKLLALDATRINSISEGDFETPSGACVTTGTTGKLGAWYNPCSTPAVAEGSGGCHMQVGSACGASIASVEQAFGASPGDVFTVSFDFDGSNLYADEPFPDQTFQRVELRVRHQSSTLANLDVFWPNTGLFSPTVARLHSMRGLTKADRTGRTAFRMRVADDLDHEASPGVLFNQCSSASGATCGGGALRYASIGFEPSTSTGSATIDDVFVDLENQVEVTLLDTAGNVLQRSTLDKGFYVKLPPMSSNPDIIVRISLRSYASDDFPTVRALRVINALDAQVTKGALVRSFSRPRLGINGMWDPPMSEVKDESVLDLTSECRDSPSAPSSNCYQYFVDRGVPLRKFFADLSWLKVRQDTTAGTYTLGLSDYGLFQLNYRIARPMRRYGHTGLMLLLNEGRVYESTDSGSGEVLTPRLLNEFSVVSAEDLVVASARYFADLFDGTKTYTAPCDSDATLTCTYTYPRFSTFELFGEVDGTAAGEVTWGSPTRDDMTVLTNRVAQAVRAEQPTATVATPGILPGYGVNRIFDVPFLNTVLDPTAPASWDATYLNGMAFHPYLDDVAPEQMRERWEAAVAEFTSRGWSGTLPAFFPEWGFTRERYDPYCQPGTTKWETTTAPNGRWSRGWGSSAHAKLTARATLEYLSLPVAEVYPYGTFTPEAQGHGYWGCTSTSGPSCYECWHADPSYNFHLFTRVPGTGPMEGGGVSVFEPNDSGSAYLAIARYLARSSPYRSTFALAEPASRDEGEHYRAALFRTQADEFVLAVWWYRDYLFAAEWMNSLTGTKDVGFRGLRIHDVAVSGLTRNIVSAESIPLDINGSPSPLTVDTSTGTPVLKRVVYGERPLLIRLRLDGPEPE